jgi:hypothetical protein
MSTPAVGPTISRFCGQAGELGCPVQNTTDHASQSPGRWAALGNKVRKIQHVDKRYSTPEWAMAHRGCGIVSAG